jgi:hypothetical protein
MRKIHALALSLLLVTPAAAQDEPAPPAETPVEPAPAAEDLTAAKLVLKNGETLVGEVVQLKGGKLKFKSQKAGDIEVNIADVESVQSAKAHKVVLVAGETLEGKVALDGTKVVVTPLGEEPIEAGREDLGSINPDPPKTEWDRWDFTATAGMTLTWGNTRSQTAAAFAQISREDDWTRVVVAYTGAYGQNRLGENAKTNRGDGKFDLKINEMFFVTPFVGHVVYDKFQNIELRYQLGAGGGVNVVKTDWIEWTVETAFSYGKTKFRRVQPGAEERIYTTSLRVATNLKLKLTDSVHFSLAWESYIGTKDIEDTVHHGVANLSVKLYKSLALSLAGIYDRQESPQRDANGRLPRENDFKLIAGLTLTL